jgi:hypothetical protein
MTPTKPTDVLDRYFASPKAADGSLWYDIRALPIEGRGWEGEERLMPFDRLPARLKPLVREGLWTLSEFSAGICVRFVTDARQIGARWKLRNPKLAMPHMPSTGMSGLDLYTRDHGRWHWVGIGRSMALENSATLVQLHPPAAGGVDGSGGREYMLYLPLYNGVESLELGLPEGATLRPAPAWPGRPDGKPILFYGTSVTHGGCASRPGMAYPAIVGRLLECPTINFGFSSNGWMELEVGKLLGELDPAIYVLDNLPNMDLAGVTKMTEPLVAILRAARPNTPIVLMEHVGYQGLLSDAPSNGGEEMNQALRAAFGRLRAAGVPNIHLVPGSSLLGPDGEATVDGSHPTDLGFLRMAEALVPLFRTLG